MAMMVPTPARSSIRTVVENIPAQLMAVDRIDAEQAG
jgi:hypothetical protein